MPRMHGCTMATKKQMLEFLSDTRKFYSADPNGRRAVLPNGSCSYLTTDGRQCAVGRHLSGPELQQLYDSRGSMFFLWCHDSQNNLKAIDPDHYLLNFPASLINRVQGLHDSSDYWNTEENRISRQGIRAFAELRKAILSGAYSRNELYLNRDI